MSGTILIADPVATNRITIKVRLAAACYGTAMAGSVDEAVAAARRSAPDLIVVDESLLQAGNSGLIARLADHPPTRGVPVIALCGPSGRLAALRAGADAVVDRPADEFMLLARIRSLLAARGAGFLRDGASGAASAAEVNGLAEAQAPFAPAPAPTPVQTGTGRLVLVADPPTVIGWRQALGPRTSLTIEANTPERALADASAGRPADIYMIAADLALPGDGLRLLSELRARPASRDAAFVIALPEDRATLGPVALDLGADDVLPLFFRDRPAGDEAALRLVAQLGRKRAADHRRAAAERERLWAVTDPLTGLHNRRYALPRLEAMAATDWRGELAVMVVDLDRFKAINDRLGHAAGDSVLTEVAARLADALPAGALLARIGGEEFLVAVPGLSPRQAEATAETLRLAVAARPVALPPLLGGGAIAVTASVGLAHEGAGESAAVLMLRADRALLSAKEHGRNRVITARHEAAA